MANFCQQVRKPLVSYTRAFTALGIIRCLIHDVTLGVEFSNEAERKKNSGKGDSASEPSRFTLLCEGEMQQIWTERHW